jgi:site-specific DNA recombinase
LQPLDAPDPFTWYEQASRATRIVGTGASPRARTRDVQKVPLMIAAIYARKSTEQRNADAEAKSVVRQIENARAFAKTKGWRVDEDHVYSDDAISGAETRKLVNRQRLLDALDGDRPPFQLLIMRDASRFSRRDGDEAFGELKRLAQRGIEIHFYEDASRFAFGTLGDNVVGFMRAEMNAEYRRQIARFTKEAMVRKAQAGHVTGGKCFGYDNVRMNGHTERRINDAQAAVVRRIFALCAAGMGYTRIAKTLNAEGAVTPTPTRGGPAGWSHSSVYEVLHRTQYRGEVIYNRTRRRNPDGATGFAARPESEWLHFDRPDLRILDDEAWQAAHARLDGSRAHLAQLSGGRWARRRRDSDSKYLLSGFTRCAHCKSSIGVLYGRQYGCTAYHQRGTSVCRNFLKMPLTTVDEAVLGELHKQLRPKMVLAIVDGLLARLAPTTLDRDVRRNRAEVQKLEVEIARLAEAIATGGELASLLDAMKRRQAQRDEIRATITAHEAVDTTRVDRAKVTRTVRRALDEWQAVLREASVAPKRQLLRTILRTPLMLTPQDRAYYFEGELVVGSLLLGKIGLPTNLVRPAQLERATSWFVAANTFVEPAQLTTQKDPRTARHLDPILDPRMLETEMRDCARMAHRAVSTNILYFWRVLSPRRSRIVSQRRTLDSSG